MNTSTIAMWKSQLGDSTTKSSTNHQRHRIRHKRVFSRPGHVGLRIDVAITPQIGPILSEPFHHIASEPRRPRRRFTMQDQPCWRQFSRQGKSSIYKVYLYRIYVYQASSENFPRGSNESSLVPEFVPFTKSQKIIAII
jgi:hypothetical protein